MSALALATVESRTGVSVIRSSNASMPIEGAEERGAHLTLKQIETLKQEISELRGLIELQDHEMQQLRKSQEEFYLDLDKRLSQLQSSDSNTKTKKKLVQPETRSSKIESQFSKEDIDLSKTEVSAEVSETKTISSPDENVVAKNETILPPLVTEKDVFDDAYKFVRTKQYPEAISGFKEYLNRSPKGEYAPNANYWLGEIYMSQWQADKTNRGLLDRANQSFLNITSQFPKHPKVMDALLKLGLIENEKGNLDAARQYLTEVKDRYPDSAAARIAETRLQQLH